MRRAAWTTDTSEDRGGGCSPHFLGDQPSPGFTRKWLPVTDDAEAEKAIFHVRACDFEQKIEWLRKLVVDSELSEANATRMLRAIDKLRDAKREMAQIIDEEQGYGG